MRGEDRRSGSLFSYVDLEARVPADHPLRLIREVLNDVLASMSLEFSSAYSSMGRPSIPPEQLFRALLLQAFYTIRSERQLMEQLDYNMLYRWFVGLGMDERVWDASSFCKNRDRLLSAAVANKLLCAVTRHRQVRQLLSRDHFTVDGTLVQSWASMKSFRPKQGDDTSSGGTGGDAGGQSEAGRSEAGAGRNGEQNFHGQKRSNQTHESTTDRDTRLYRKGNGRESKLCFMGHALMENRNGLVVGGSITIASGTAERDAALEMLDRYRPMGAKGGGRRLTLAADKGYDVADFVEALRARKVTPHVAVQDHLTKTGKRRRTKTDARTTRHPGYGISQVIRKRVEEIFGWVKGPGGQDKTKFRGRARVEGGFILSLTAFNLIRLPRLLAALPP